MGHAGLEKYSREIQNRYFDWIEGKEYDVLPRDKFQLFDEILRNYYQSEDLIHKLREKVLPRSGCLWYRVVLVNCCADDNYFCCPVISLRISDSDIVFYDLECRRYVNWNAFLTDNHLPKCLMKYPKGGVYKKKDGKLELEEQESPACSMARLIWDGVYIAAKYIALGASIAMECKSAQPYNKAIAAVSFVANGCTIGQHGLQLHDRAKHDQSIDYSDPQAKHQWNSMMKESAFFVVTLGQMTFGTPKSDVVINQNLLLNFKIFSPENDPKLCLEQMQSILLRNHLCEFDEQAQQFLKDNIIFRNIDVAEVMSCVRKFVLKNNLISDKFRALAIVDADAISTVANGIAFSKEIPKLFQTELHSKSQYWSQVVDDVMQAMKSWVAGNTTLRQLNFRVYRACGGSKGFETIEEMCEHFKVGKSEDIQRNHKYLFKGSGEKFLNFFKEHSSKENPELLSCIVEYLEGSNDDDIDSFKKFWYKRLIKESKPTRSLQITPSEIHWMNAVNLEILSYTHSVPAEGNVLVRPMMGNFNEISVDDLYKLAKKLLGRIGDVEMQMVRPDVDWVVVASKNCRFTVIIGPKTSVIHAGSKTESYPVFKRPLL